MNYFELYDDRDAVLDRLEQLKSQGYYEEDIHLLGRDDAEFTALDYTEVEYHIHVPDEGGLKEILSRNESAERFLHKYELDDEEIERYLFKISDGNFLMYYNDEPLEIREDEREGRSSSSEAELEDNTLNDQ